MIEQIDKEAIKIRIHEEIEATREQILRLESRVKPISPDNSIGRLSRLEAISAKEVNDSALASAKQKLARLISTLQHVDEPEFGLCFECGEPIPIGRILLIPEAKMCVQCAELNE